MSLYDNRVGPEQPIGAAGGPCHHCGKSQKCVHYRICEHCYYGFVVDQEDRRHEMQELNIPPGSVVGAFDPAIVEEDPNDPRFVRINIEDMRLAKYYAFTRHDGEVCLIQRTESSVFTIYKSPEGYYMNKDTGYSDRDFLR